MEIYAKNLLQDDGTSVYQSLSEHTQWVIEEALQLVDDYTLKKISNVTGVDAEWIVDLIFMSAYFHDIGKATKEFQSTIHEGTISYHSLYSASVLVGIEDFEYKEGEYFINLLLVTVLTHHTLLPYRALKVSFSFLPQAEEIFKGYSKSYEKHLRRECKYCFDFEIYEEIKIELEAIEDDLKYIHNHQRLRTLYTYISGILNLADWLASARFSRTYNMVSFEKKPSKESFMRNLSFDKLRDFQEQLSTFHNSVLVEIPTGEGKTEGSLLWAIKNIPNNYSKIIYTLPTQTTSNKLYERVQDLFDKERCGLIHSSAKIYLERKYEEENGEIDEVFKSDFLLSKSFNKPVTVSTIDSLLKYFINIGRFNIATRNYFNSVVIIDEVHVYDFKLMGFLKRFLELCKEFEVPVCLMSASIPDSIKRLLGIEHYPVITQSALFEKKANQIYKKEMNLDDDLESVVRTYREGKKVLVIRNTVKSATQTYKTLKDMGVENIVLYHSTFKKRDRTRKEDLIFEKLDAKEPFILVATQIVEISLDIDFNVMFTDNAPIDALIQRFGRVNRKKNPERKGTIYVHQVENPLPYREMILDLTFETMEEGYFELGRYVKWLNCVYERLFAEDITIQNEIQSLFDNAYKKYDETIKKLHGIEQSPDNYDLRDIEESKNGYLLYEDFMNDNISPKEYYEYSISLPFYLEKEYLHEVPPEREKGLYYKVLKLDYSFEEGVILEDRKSFLIL